MSLSLSVKKRPLDQKAKAIRSSKIIPAVMYGSNFESTPITLDYQVFEKTFKQVRYHKTFDIELDKKKIKVVIREVVRHPVTSSIEHVDFLVVDEKRKIIAPVPIEFIGESAALRIGAILTVSLPTVRVKAFPQDIPEIIQADISKLESDGDKIRISDITHSKKYEYLQKDIVMVAKVEFSRAGKMEEEALAATTEEGESSEEGATKEEETSDAGKK